ncbi:MarR family winged helix-turn-helix transcriptional regulator [Nocardia sp. NPDC020380]|uniref:MarR family winged helix-turn-helix transcriptional regulator n=1 Tax=Nocardia sp. NPDC020380 TaxID=3364309 RepID=UPI00379DF3DD
MAKESADTLEQDTTPEGFDQFVRASHELFVAMRRNRGRLAQDRSGLTPAQLGLLDAVADRGPMPVGQIATYAGVAGPTATRMLKQLEADGVVTRERSSEDERRVDVALTDHGRELVDRQRLSLREAQRRHYAALSPRQRAEFVDVLQQMAAWLEQGVPDDPE